MPDTFGLLEVPLPAPAAGTSVGDPLLDVTLAFMQAVINAKTKLAWKNVCAYPTKPNTESLPVSFAFSHCPTNESFSTGKLPALFCWRINDQTAKSRYTQEWLIRESTLALLWVPPRPTQEQARQRESFKNAVAAVMALAIERGRDPAWKVLGDTYYDAQTYGSTYQQQAKLARAWFREAAPHPIQIEFDDGPKEPFDALLGQIDVWEVLQWADGSFAPIDHIEGTTTTNGLDLVDFSFKMSVTGVSPASGLAAGNTPVTFTGRQFMAGASVTIAGLACGSVVLADDGVTLTATTPAHVAGGPFDVIVTNPSGASSKLPAAFTFT